MKTTTLKNRLEKRYNGARNSKAYQIVNSMIEANCKIIRTCHTSGSGRYTTNLDYTEEVKRILMLIGVKFESGNDSPRGGKPGNFIKIITKIQ